jgi:hypothetical protein
MCVTDLPGDPDGVLVLHDAMKLVDVAYVPPVRTRRPASSSTRTIRIWTLLPHVQDDPVSRTVNYALPLWWPWQ